MIKSTFSLGYHTSLEKGKFAKKDQIRMVQNTEFILNFWLACPKCVMMVYRNNISIIT